MFQNCCIVCPLPKISLFWTPRGELLRNQRRIPVTNISELVEYVLLPHNTDVTRPRALNTFLDGLAQLGVDKRLIKNKKVLSDILQKEQAYRDKEESDNETSDGNSTDSSDEETASESNRQQQESEKVSDPELEAVTKLNIALLKFLQKNQLRVITAKAQMCLPLWL